MVSHLVCVWTLFFSVFWLLGFLVHKLSLIGTSFSLTLHLEFLCFEEAIVIFISISEICVFDSTATTGQRARFLVAEPWESFLYINIVFNILWQEKKYAICLCRDAHLLDEALEVCAFMCIYAHVLTSAWGSQCVVYQIAVTLADIHSVLILPVS